MGGQVHEFEVGALRCAVVSDVVSGGAAAAPLPLFFNPESGVSQEALAQGVAEVKGRTTIDVNYNCLLVRAESGNVLVDTGLGERFHGYGEQLGALLGMLGSSLAATGARPETIQKVIFTHLHQDHLRGSIWSGAPTFAVAEYIASAVEVAFWTSPAALAGSAKFEAEQARAALATLDGSLRTVRFDETITPEISCVDASGHTPGHMALLIRGGSDRLLCAGDLFYDVLQLRHPEWATPYDLDRPASVATRRRLVAWAAEERLTVLSYHMPFPGLGRISRQGSAFDWEPVRAGD
jgi:glyoxylase-like metal-dependent hydrolase (beta-lactamase superfamily II)